MGVVRGSKQDHLRVVPDYPGTRLRKRFVFALLLCICSVGGFLLGEYMSLGQQRSATVERDSLREELARKRGEIATLEQEVTSLRMGANIDRQSTDAVRSTIRQLEEEKFQLQQDLSFYKNIMAPNTADKGIRIQKIDLLRAEKPRQYRLKVMISQVSDSNTMLSGTATISVVGRQDGVEKTLPLKDLTEEVSANDIKLGFRYFQNIPGPDERYAELTLPVNFEPDYLLVVAKSRGAKPKHIEQKHMWNFKEKMSDASKS